MLCVCAHGHRTAVGFNDRMTDCKPRSHAVGLRSEERQEDAVDVSREYSPFRCPLWNRFGKKDQQDKRRRHNRAGGDGVPGDIVAAACCVQHDCTD